VTVGRVTAVAWPGQGPLAVALAQAADRTPPFPGIGPLPDRPIRLILAPTRARFDSLTGGRLPQWSEGAAFPEAGTIVLLATRRSSRLPGALRHEMAHLVLRWRLGHPPPLWFDEGYAAFAAGEWDRLDALGLNWQIARGARMDLADMDRALRSDEADAQTAYALATTAVLLLNRWGGAQGLTPLISRLAELPGRRRGARHVARQRGGMRGAVGARRCVALRLVVVGRRRGAVLGAAGAAAGVARGNQAAPGPRPPSAAR
jgi:hypothetical protein